ncbi:hybrid sensor histidine kinase/response regulator [Spirosoma pulveris]
MNSLLQPDPLHTAAQQRTLIQNQAFQAAVNGEPLVNALNILARMVKLELGNRVRTAFYLAYPDGKRLHAIEGAGDMPPTYTAPLNGFPVSEDSFCSGYAMATARPVHTPDVFKVPTWQPFLHLATAHQFRAASSYPILNRQGKAIGSLALYFPDIHQATAQESALARAITQAAAIILSQDTQTLEHTRAQNALRQSQEKYRTLFETIDEGYAFCQLVRDPTGQVTDYRILELNPAFEQQIGIQRADCLGRTAREVFPGYDGWWIDTYARVVDTNQPVHFEHLLDNTGRWYAISAYSHGSDYFAVLFDDITERKLREEQQAFLLRFSDSLRLESETDALANRALQLLAEQLQLDRCCLAVYQLADDRAEITHQVGNDRLPPLPQHLRRSDFPDAFPMVLAETLVIDEVGQTKGLTELDRQHLGAWGFSALVVAPLRPGAHQHGWVILAMSARPRAWTPGEIQLIEEVSERTWSAVERAKAEAALRLADRRKDEFLAMLSHELRNPMATLHNTLALLKLTQGQDQSLPLEKALAIMSRESGHLNRMVDDLLDVSRISQGLIQLRKTRIDLTTLVGDALEASMPEFTHRHQVLVTSLASGPFWVEADATRLTQVVRNLLTNAAKYTPNGGRIEVRLAQENRQAVLRVRDTGIGLAADQLAAIFEVFVQVSTSLARTEGGLGLGLTVVKQLVEQHGGRVAVKSPGLGQGSEFIVTLPSLADSHLAENQAGRSATSCPAPQRILVVDDNADLALTTAMWLRHNQYEVQTCLSGAAALEAIEGFAPGAVLLDLSMPDLDGYETCRRLRGMAWGKQGVIVALSGYGQESDRIRTQAAGFDEHLVKPVDLNQLVEVLTKLLSPMKQSNS